jgi:type IV secretory pathway VirB6-like protein
MVAANATAANATAAKRHRATPLNLEAIPWNYRVVIGGSSSRRGAGKIKVS